MAVNKPVGVQGEDIWTKRSRGNRPLRGSEEGTCRKAVQGHAQGKIMRG